MKLDYIDINCDVGERMANEVEIFPYISSCNIACGGHTGDEDSMVSTIKRAKQYRIKIGAHPSYPDKENFGRVSVKIDEQELSDSIQNQIELLASVCEKEKIKLHHIKPHGALYNDIAKDKELALIFLKAIEEYKSQLFLYVPYTSVIEKLALEQGFYIKREAFGDRNYNTNLSLVSRKIPKALITNPKAVLEHLVIMVKKGLVQTVSGTLIKMQADTYCIHGDTPTALQILMYLSKQLPNQNILLKK